MKKLFITFILIAFTLIIKAQNNDEKAIELYAQALQKFELNDFTTAYIKSEEAKKFFKTTPPTKLKYLFTISFRNAICGNEINVNKTCYSNDLNNYTFLLYYCNEILKEIDINTYPAEKYEKLIEAKDFANQGIKKYAYQKDRKPEDAIAFLNETAAKFPYRKYSNQKCDTATFSLKDDILEISNIFFVGEDNFAKRFNYIIFNKLYIKLSKSWKIGRELFSQNKEGNFLFIKRFIKSKDSRNFDYKNSKEFEEFNKSNFENAKLVSYNEKGINFFDFSTLEQIFDFENKEFIKGEYSHRIQEALKFLFEYYGTNEPIVDEEEVKKNKF